MDHHPTHTAPDALARPGHILFTRTDFLSVEYAERGLEPRKSMELVDRWQC